jgi:phosphoserine phosphatase
MSDDMPATGAAFFDLDRTIISGSSVFAFGIAAYRAGMVSNRDLIADALGAIGFLFMGASDEKTEAVKNRVLDAITGVEVAKAIGMTGGIGTIAETVDGVYTGRLAAPFTYGQGKADAVERIAAARDYDLALSYAYTDSAGDLPMLETVGHPVAVNPDRALEAVAAARGWPIVEFSRTRKKVVKRTTAAAGAAALAGLAYAAGRAGGRRSMANRSLLQRVRG